MNKNTSLIKRDSEALVRVSKSLEITSKLLDVKDDTFLIPYRKGKKWGFCDRNKRIVIPCIYENLDFFSEDLAIVGLNGKFGVIDKKGKEIIPCIFERVYNFNEGLSRLKLNGKWGGGLTKLVRK